MKYYFTYNGNVAVLMSNMYLNFPAEDLNISVEVAGISFHYNSLRMIKNFGSEIYQKFKG